MYALKLTKYKMFIRESDGYCTDNKTAAILFNTVEQAKDYVVGWRETSQVVGKASMKISIVEVETKLVIQKVGKKVDEV